MPDNSGDLTEKASLCAELKQALSLNENPVAAAILQEPPPGIRPWRRKATPCVMLQSARRGTALYCSGESIFCSGRPYLGLGEPPIPDLENFLVNTEKLAASPESARKIIAAARKPAPQNGKYLALAPLEKADFAVDVVLFTGTPFQIGRLIFLDAFETGQIDTRHGEPFCSGTISTPIATGKIGISFLDMTCRMFGRYRAEEMVAGVPADRLPRIVSSISRSIAGTAKPDIIKRWWQDSA